MNVGSLFSGIGGIELGFEREGFKTEWFVECEPYAQTILRKHFPETIIYGDIKKTDFNNVPRVDILTGGFPCQDISNAGKRIGISGSRSSLWKYYLEAIRILRPKFAVIENVSAIIDRGLNVVLADLASVGYDAEWHCFSASSIGALHRRDRIIIISYPHSSRHLYRQSKEQPTKGREQTFSKLKSSSKVYDSHLKSMERKQSKYEAPGEIRGVGSGEWGESWAVEPDVGRVAHGVSFRVDRIKCLGNAVVPQFAQVIARTIKEVIEKEGE